MVGFRHGMWLPRGGSGRGLSLVAGDFSRFGGQKNKGGCGMPHRIFPFREDSQPPSGRFGAWFPGNLGWGHFPGGRGFSSGFGIRLAPVKNRWIFCELDHRKPKGHGGLLVWSASRIRGKGHPNYGLLPFWRNSKTKLGSCGKSGENSGSLPSVHRSGLQVTFGLKCSTWNILRHLGTHKKAQNFRQLGFWFFEKSHKTIIFRLFLNVKDIRGRL